MTSLHAQITADLARIRQPRYINPHIKLEIRGQKIKNGDTDNKWTRKALEVNIDFLKQLRATCRHFRNEVIEDIEYVKRNNPEETRSERVKQAIEDMRDARAYCIRLKDDVNTKFDELAKMHANYCADEVPVAFNHDSCHYCYDSDDAL